MGHKYRHIKTLINKIKETIYMISHATAYSNKQKKKRRKKKSVEREKLLL